MKASPCIERVTYSTSINFSGQDRNWGVPFFCRSWRALMVAASLSGRGYDDLRADQEAADPLLALVAGSALVVAAGEDEFSNLVQKLQREKPTFAKRHADLLAQRYDLANRPADGVTMAAGKPVQGGVRIRLPRGMTWEDLAKLTPEEIRERDLWPAGFLPLPHPHHEAGEMIFPQPLIDETKRQTQRDLTRFDLDFDLPQHMLPEFPAPIFLTTRPDLGDVSKGQLVTLANFHRLFKDVLNPKQLEGLRLLVTPFRSSSSTRPTTAAH